MLNLTFLIIRVIIKGSSINDVTFGLLERHQFPHYFWSLFGKYVSSTIRMVLIVVLMSCPCHVKQKIGLKLSNWALQVCKAAKSSKLPNNLFAAKLKCFVFMSQLIIYRSPVVKSCSNVMHDKNNSKNLQESWKTPI